MQYICGVTLAKCLDLLKILKPCSMTIVCHEISYNELLSLTTIIL